MSQKLFCLGFLLLFCQACSQEGKLVDRQHSEEDTLAYLVSQSDLVAIVEIVDSRDAKDAPPLLGLPSTVDATISKVFKGSRNIGDKIAISRNPARLFPGISHTVLALSNGTNLVFLIDRDVFYMPLTAHSIVVLNASHITPIWRRDQDAEALSWESDIKIEDVLSDVRLAVTSQIENGKSN